MAYDRADWHSGGDFPEGLPAENGGTHIGIYLAWAILCNLEGDLLKEHSQTSLAAVRSRQMTGREFLFNECDGKFWDEDLNEEGNAFTTHYFGDQDGHYGKYIEDYEKWVSAGLPSIYHVEDTWESYDKIAPTISKQFAEWKNQPKKSRW